MLSCGTLLSALTINTVKSLLCKSYKTISCLSLCFDQLSYEVIDDRDVLYSWFYLYILISTFFANEKENQFALMCGVVAPCYQRYKQSATTPNDKKV